MFAAIKLAAALSPTFVGQLPVVPGRTLLVDGDALCYTCAGKDDTAPGQARINMSERIRKAKAACGAEFVKILVTARSSHKGYRYAIARVKPYQGQRSSGRRPKNWEFLRTLVEAADCLGYPTLVTGTAEADDYFAHLSMKLGPANVVHHTQDKDMRMVPGWHLVWDDMKLVYLEPDTFELNFNDLLYGRKWFWMQMLHGDNADYIPGLPRMMTPKGTFKLCGPAGAAEILDDLDNEHNARAAVINQYRSYYEDKWAENLLEQAVLLWMRPDPDRVFSVMEPGNPLADIDLGNAKDTLVSRITEVLACTAD